MGYEGHLLQVPDPAEKAQKIRENMALLVGCKDQIVVDSARVGHRRAGHVLHDPAFPALPRLVDIRIPWARLIRAPSGS